MLCFPWHRVCLGLSSTAGLAPLFLDVSCAAGPELGPARGAAMFHQGLAATRHPEEEALGLFPFVLPAVQAQVLDAELLLRVIKDKIVLFFFFSPFD